MDILQLAYCRLVETALSPHMVIWSPLNSLVKKLGPNLHHKCDLAYLVQWLTWRLTIALSTFNLDVPHQYYWTDSSLLCSYHPCQGVRSYGTHIIIPPINQSDTTCIGRHISLAGEYPRCCDSTGKRLEVQLDCIVVIVCLTHQLH